MDQTLRTLVVAWIAMNGATGLLVGVVYAATLLAGRWS